MIPCSIILRKICLLLLVFSPATFLCSSHVFREKKCEYTVPWFHACYILFFYVTEVINSVFWRIGILFLYSSSIVLRRPNFSHEPRVERKTFQANYLTCLSIKKIYCAFKSWRLICALLFRKNWLFRNSIFLFRKNSTFFLNQAPKFKYPSRSDRG
jgi:hypothetical protein